MVRIMVLSSSSKIIINSCQRLHNTKRNLTLNLKESNLKQVTTQEFSLNTSRLKFLLNKTER